MLFDLVTKNGIKYNYPVKVMDWRLYLSRLPLPGMGGDLFNYLTTPVVTRRTYFLFELDETGPCSEILMHSEKKNPFCLGRKLINDTESNFSILQKDGIINKNILMMARAQERWVVYTR